jgi:hypothetical protein
MGRDGGGRVEYVFRCHVLGYASVAICVLVFEEVQRRLGQTMWTTIRDVEVLLFALFIADLFGFRSLCFAVIAVFEVFETGCWVSAGSGITASAVKAMKYDWILFATPELEIWQLLLVLAFGGLAYYPLGIHSISVTTYFVPLAALWTAVGVMQFATDKYVTLFPFWDSIRMPEQRSDRRVARSFEGNFSCGWRNASAPRRNLIMIEAESLETGFIGRFNPKFPKSMPWISRLAEDHAVFPNVESQPYTTWSAAGMFVTECSFPLVYSHVEWQTREQQHWGEYAKLPCISTFLKRQGYHLYAVAAGSLDMMHMKEFYQMHGFLVEDIMEHGKDHDRPTLTYIVDTLLPKMIEPFMLVILTTDTHFWPAFHVEPDRYIEKLQYPNVLRSFTSLDISLEKFVHSLEAKGLHERSELVIFGDHLCMGYLPVLSGIRRRLVAIFPWRKRDERGLKKKLSYYDMAPTMLESLGLEYSPRFPWGSDIFGEDTGRVPDVHDLHTIYSINTGDVEAESVSCLGQSGFCEGNEVGDRYGRAEIAE